MLQINNCLSGVKYMPTEFWFWSKIESDDTDLCDGGKPTVGYGLEHIRLSNPREAKWMVGKGLMDS
jgi:hypothetical protein